MKLINKLNPKQLLTTIRPKKTRSVSRSDPSSFSSATSSLSSDESPSVHHEKSQTGKTTPTSVLPELNHFDFVQAFNMMDKDNDGKIPKKDLENLLSRVGGADDEIVTMLSEVDADGDGCISLEEFGGAIGAVFGPPSCDAELREAFDFFDADNDGKITAEELQEVFDAIGGERCTLEECRRMIRGVDKNGDGFVCFEDFSRMMELQR